MKKRNPPQFLWGQEIGVFQKMTVILEIPRFLAPIEIEGGFLSQNSRELKVLAIVKVLANTARTQKRKWTFETAFFKKNPTNSGVF